MSRPWSRGTPQGPNVLEPARRTSQGPGLTWSCISPSYGPDYLLRDNIGERVYHVLEMDWKGREDARRFRDKHQKRLVDQQGGRLLKSYPPVVKTPLLS